MRDLSELKDSTINDESNIDCLTSGSQNTEKKVVYRLQEGKSLKLNIIDLSSGNMNVSIKVFLSHKSTCMINLASVCQKGSQKTFNVETIHEEGDSYSRTKMAGINLGDGSLFFLGTSDVYNNAHGSDTRQEGKITNLSPKSKSEVSPALLIKDDDVKASHGAALGAYNPESMYYMMSRGLSEAESRRLITIGSLIPVIESVSDKQIAEEAMKSLEALSI